MFSKGIYKAGGLNPQPHTSPVALFTTDEKNVSFVGTPLEDTRVTLQPQAAHDEKQQRVNLASLLEHYGLRYVRPPTRDCGHRKRN